MGNSALPFADGLIRYPQGVRKLLLRQPFGAARGRDLLSRISGVPFDSSLRGGFAALFLFCPDCIPKARF